MKTRPAAALFLLLITGGCSNMEPIEFKDSGPTLRIEEYFLGKTRAWGIFEDRFGRLRRQFTVSIHGRIKDGELVLDEHFEYADGERDRRIWRIRKTGEHAYEGRAADVIGVAKGEAYGNALNWRYDMDLPVGGRKIRVTFNDWMFLQPSDVLVNRARVTKFGIEIGQVTLFFNKQKRIAASAPVFTYELASGEPEARRAANQ